MSDEMRNGGSGALLEVDGLCVSVTTGAGQAAAVEGLSLRIDAGEAVGLVGESGSGKSLTLRGILGLLPPGAAVTGGRVLFEGTDLLANGNALRRVRGTGISMIFQEPMTSLSPVAKVGDQIVDAARRHRAWSRAEARHHAVRMAREMGIPDAEACLSQYPHELSGGLRQRVMIAAALAGQPRLLLCDEPTTALDVTIQDQIVQLLARLQDKLSMSLLYVTHDLAVVAQLCDRVEVMYAGRIVESGPVADAFTAPIHPYTLGLVRATPDVDHVRTELYAIPGHAPSIGERPPGCTFHPRCAFASVECRSGSYPLRALTESRATACAFPERCGTPHEAEVAD